MLSLQFLLLFFNKTDREEITEIISGLSNESSLRSCHTELTGHIAPVKLSNIMVLSNMTNIQLKDAS